MATTEQLKAMIPTAFSIAEIASYGPGGLTVTIKAAEGQEVGAEREVKPVLKFQETAKYLVINTTRSQQLADLFGAKNDPSGNAVKLTVGRPNKTGEQIIIGAAD